MVSVDWLNMGKLIESRSKKPIRDVRQFEEEHCLTLLQAAQLEQYLGQLISNPRRWAILRDAYAIRTILRTGLRRFEFCKARCGDVDLVAGKFWTVGKGNIKDFVPLPNAAQATLRDWLAARTQRGDQVTDRTFLFPGRAAGPLSFSALRLRWKQILAGAKLSLQYGLHTLRHTAGLLVYGQTGSLEKTARFLRHTSTATTARYYLHIDAEALKQELNGIDIWRE